MLRMDRADYTIDYELALTLVDTDVNTSGTALLSLPILGASEPLIGSLACPRNAWGWATLLRIGQVLAAPAGTQSCANAWPPDSARRPGGSTAAGWSSSTKTAAGAAGLSRATSSLGQLTSPSNLAMLAVPRQRMQAMKLPWAFMLCALMATPTLSQEPTQPRMQWLMGSQPLDPQGRPIASPGQALVEFMKTAWPEVHHEILYANGKRSMQLLMEGEPACHVALVRTLERERQLLFTTTVLMPPPSVIVRRDSLARLPRDTQGAVDLPALLRHPASKAPWSAAAAMAKRSTRTCKEPRQPRPTP